MARLDNGTVGSSVGWGRNGVVAKIRWRERPGAIFILQNREALHSFQWSIVAAYRRDQAGSVLGKGTTPSQVFLPLPVEQFQIERVQGSTPELKPLAEPYAPPSRISSIS